MLKSKKNWHYAQEDVTYTSTVDVLDQYFKQKGLSTKAEKTQFLKPDLSKLQSPILFKDIEKAADRVIKAIETDELIMVYGDYDADGVTSTALMMNILIELGANCDYFVPNRFEHGYGLNEKVLKEFAEQGATVIITVDTGIANVDEVAYANTLGLDVIITDHHEPQELLPEAYAIIHPKLSDECHFKEYAGVGVAFQFARQLVGETPMHLLPLVAIGTVADMVPLIEDNRTLTFHGLKLFKDDMPIGLEYLLKMAQINEDETITSRDIGFKIGPRLNAVGRLADAQLAVELLLTMDPYIAEKIAGQIEQLNDERKGIVEDIVKTADDMVDANDGVIMLYDETWHEGVLGIAASRLVRKYDRPVIMLTFNEATQELKGSARSILGFSIFDALQKISHLFSKFGGHSQAAGMTFSMDNFLKIKQALNDEIFTQLTADDFKQTIENIKRVDIDILSEKLVYEIQQFAPFGMSNEEPTFHILAKPSSVRAIGQENKHLKIQFKRDKKIIDAIGFQMGHLAALITDTDEIQLVGKLQINEWNGTRTVQLLIDDLKIATLQVFDFRANGYLKHFKPFYDVFNHHLMIGLTDQYMSAFLETNENIHTLKYGEELLELVPIDILYVTQLPNNINDLKLILEYYQPKNIHLSYEVIDDAFMNALPQRDDFKWTYAYIHKKQPLHSKVGLNEILKVKKWRKEKLLFMIKVFYELEFIEVKNDYIYINEAVRKQALSASKTYQEYMQQSEIEQKLYYSSSQEIKQWIEGLTHEFEKTKEKVIYGL